MPVNGKHFLNAFAIQIRLLSNQKLTRIQISAKRKLQNKVFGFWEKYEIGEKNSGSIIIEIDVEIKRTFKSRIITCYTFRLGLYIHTYIHTYIHVGLGYMCRPAILKEINEL